MNTRINIECTPRLLKRPIVHQSEAAIAEATDRSLFIWMFPGYRCNALDQLKTDKGIWMELELDWK